jgi:outer membrane lipoprotein-sorting protein
VRRLGLMCAVFMFLGTPVLAVDATSQPARPATVDTVESVLRDVQEKYRRNTTVTGVIQTHVIATPPIGRVETRGRGKFELQRGPSKTHVRFELENAIVIESGGTVRQENRSQKVFSDGETVYQLRETDPGTFAAFKLLHKGVETFDVDIILRTLVLDNNLALRPEALVDGEAVYVIEAQPKLLDKGDEIVRRDLYFSKRTGLLMQRVGFNEAAREIERFQVRDVRIDVEIPADRFVFVPPPGVEVVDFTGSQQIAETQPGVQILREVPKSIPVSPGAGE